MINIFKKSIKKEITELSKQILNEILRNEKILSKIDSSGINDGKEIITEYLTQNEIGLAFEHLEYVVSETEFILTAEQIDKMNTIAVKLGIK